MKLLFITRRVDKDDGLTGFTFNWLQKFSERLEELLVICLEQGNISGLPANVHIFSLGKENGKNRWREFWKFQSLAKKLTPQVDAVFSHQNPEYGILIAPYAKLYRKKMIAWYAHGAISWKLRLLNMLADKIITSTEQGLRLRSHKKVVLHQGIDTAQFAMGTVASSSQIRLLSISRLGATKNIHLMIDLLAILQSKIELPIFLDIVGTASTTSDHSYLEVLKNKVKESGLSAQINFLGSVANQQTLAYYQSANFFLNFSDTGSLDKAILEAMSCGTIVISSNAAAAAVLPETLIFTSGDLAAAAEKIIAVLKLSDQARQDLRLSLRNKILEQHSLEQLVTDILKQFS